jgi:hypothetical protein
VLFISSKKKEVMRVFEIRIIKMSFSTSLEISHSTSWILKAALGEISLTLHYIFYRFLCVG